MPELREAVAVVRHEAALTMDWTTRGRARAGTDAVRRAQVPANSPLRDEFEHSSAGPICHYSATARRVCV
jgi:hypothetical protein